MHGDDSVGKKATNGEGGSSANVTTDEHVDRWAGAAATTLDFHGPCRLLEDPADLPIRFETLTFKLTWGRLRPLVSTTSFAF